MSQLRVYCTITAKNGERVPLEIDADCTPKELRAAVAGATRIPLGQLRLIFRGRMIKDDETSKAVAAYKLEADCVLHCMGQPAEGAAPAPAAATPAPAVAAPAAVAAVPGVAPSVPAAAAAPVPSPAPSDPLGEALRVLRVSNPPEAYKTAVTTLSKILSNIVDHPMEEKYRKVKKQNAAFQKRLGGLPGGDAAMRAAGFGLGEDDAGAPVYQLVPSPEAWPRLVAAKDAVETAVQEARRTPAPPVAAAPVPPLGGVPPAGGMPPNMAAAMNDPRMQAGMARMMNNPEGLRAMMQNPMMQQMIMNDPNVPPHMREGMRQLMDNPAMMEQVANMMSNPAQMERMRAQMGLGGANPPPPAAQGGGGAPPPPSRGSDQDQTEDEMIAEAIRRSLEEG